MNITLRSGTRLVQPESQQMIDLKLLKIILTQFVFLIYFKFYLKIKQFY